jgi:hypothetical protein
MKLFKCYFFRNYEQFANELGYDTWSETRDNTFFIFHTSQDGGVYVTQLLNNAWAVWNNEGQPPYKFVAFSSWDETIKYLRRIFIENGYPETNWFPEGYKKEEDVFLNPPQKDKKL